MVHVTFNLFGFFTFYYNTTEVKKFHLQPHNDISEESMQSMTNRTHHWPNLSWRRVIRLRRIIRPDINSKSRQITLGKNSSSVDSFISTSSDR